VIWSEAPTATELGKAAAVVVCIGEGAYAEKPGDIDDAALPVEEVQEVARIAEAVRQSKGKGQAVVPLVGVLMEGRPRVLQGIPDLTQAFVHAMLPGPAGGRAIADILLGLTVRAVVGACVSERGRERLARCGARSSQTESLGSAPACPQINPPPPTTTKKNETPLPLPLFLSQPPPPHTHHHHHKHHKHGRQNPSARLPFTYPKHTGTMLHQYHGKPSEKCTNLQAAFPSFDTIDCPVEVRKGGGGIWCGYRWMDGSTDMAGDVNPRARE
jgi:hypothetical protein